MSAANVRQLNTLQAAYAGENKDSFANPFQGAGNPNGVSWTQVYVQARANSGQTWIWDFGDTGFETEMFSAHWASLMMAYLNDGNLRSEICFAPGDRAVRQRYQQNLSTSNPNAGADGFLWDGSYWMSPTAWFKTSRYTSDLTVRPTSQLLNRNRYDNCAFPQAKVLLWERFDFSGKQNRRIAPTGGRANLAPMWNNPEAKPWVGLVDGSADTVVMSKLHELADSTDPRMNTEYRPSGVWRIPDSILGDPSDLYSYGLRLDGLENGMNNTTSWRSFFWATRRGMSGRDLAR